MGIFKGFKKKNSNLKIHVGEISGSYDYFINFKKKHPTYETIVSDYFIK